jgi:hypothetical protein
MSYSGYYSSKNCCVKSKDLCPTTCPAGPTGPIGPVGPVGPTGEKGIDISGACFGDYIYWNTNTNSWVVGSDNIILGCGAGQTNQGVNAVAIGKSAGNLNQDDNAISIGSSAGRNSQGQYSIAIGNQSAENSQGQYSIAMGFQAGNTGQGQSSISIGYNSGENAQGRSAVSIGEQSGQSNQGEYAIAIGFQAGENTQGISAVAIGKQAGQSNQGEYAVAVGYNAGLISQGANAVAIGVESGNANQPNNSIIINATGSALNGATQNACYIKPIRNDYNNKSLLYDEGTGEITYDNNQFNINGNLDLSCNLINDVSGIFFCDGTYIGHGNSFDISSNQSIHLKSTQDIIIEPSSSLVIKGTLDMCGNNIINVGLNNILTNNSFTRFNPSTYELSYKSINYASLSSDVSQNITPFDTIIPLVYNTIDISSGIYYDPINSSRIKFNQPGVYKIGSSIRFSQTQDLSGTVFVWFMDTGVNIPNSASMIYISGINDKTLNYVEIIYEINNVMTQYIEVVMQSSISQSVANAIASNGNIPAIPSIITSVIQIV